MVAGKDTIVRQRRPHFMRIRPPEKKTVREDITVESTRLPSAIAATEHEVDAGEHRVIVRPIEPRKGREVARNTQLRRLHLEVLHHEIRQRVLRHRILLGERRVDRDRALLARDYLVRTRVVARRSAVEVAGNEDGPASRVGLVARADEQERSSQTALDVGAVVEVRV